MRLAFLASHNGSSARAITQACRNGSLTATSVLLISNNAESKALTWAQEEGLTALCVNTSTQTQSVDDTIAALLKEHAIDLVLCSGYMKLIGPKTIDAVQGRILNVHPALLPRHGGKGMYGRHVHQAVFDNRETETGVTIHWVDQQYDHGATLAQTIVPVLETDSVDDIEAKVKAAEPDFYVETVRKILVGEFSLPASHKA